MTDETQLGRELSHRAEDVHGTTLTFEDVRGRARQIRRRRAAGGVVAVVAAVVLVLVPVSVLSGTLGGDGSPQPAPSPTQGIDPLGDGLPVLQDGVIVYPGDHPEVRLHLDGGMTPDGFAALGADRHVVTAQTGDGERAVVVVDESGTATATYPLSNGLAATAGSTAVAWMDPDGTPMLLTADADEPQELTTVEGSDPSAVAVTGDCSDLCTVTVSTRADGFGPSWQVDTTGHVSEAPIPFVLGVSPAGGQVAGLTREAPDGIHVCGGVYTLGAGDFLWKNCDDNHYDFSPGGDYVATTFGEGFGPNRIAIRDAHSGTELASIDTDAMFSGWAWQGNDLLVVEATEDGATLRSLSLDGTVETLLENVSGGLYLPTTV